MTMMTKMITTPKMTTMMKTTMITTPMMTTTMMTQYFVYRGQHLRSKERHVRCLDAHSRLGTACPRPEDDNDDNNDDDNEDDN